MLMSGLSGNEIYCLAQKGWNPGEVVVGNSVYSLGALRSFTSGLRTTSFLEFGHPSAPPDRRKWARLHKHLDELGVQFSKAPDRWVGPRPTLPDYVPAIGRLKHAPNVLYAFGHAHLGLTMSAITAELIAALATDAPPSIDLKPFQIERFS